MQAPRQVHLKATHHVLKYLKQEPSLGIFSQNKTTLKSQSTVIQIGGHARKLKSLSLDIVYI